MLYPTPSIDRRIPRTWAGVIFALIAGALASCSSTIKNRDPVGQVFPSVTGESLSGEKVSLPPSSGSTILLIGYVQKAQFDADRWIYGLLQAGIAARIIELPTIPGIFPNVISGSIDSGMKSGIPSEDWASVVTLYGSGARTVVEFTGNETPRNIRVALLDGAGRVRWFHDRGFSAGKLIELQKTAATLTAGS